MAFNTSCSVQSCGFGISSKLSPDVCCRLILHNLIAKAIAATTDRISKIERGIRAFALAVWRLSFQICLHLEINNLFIHILIYFSMFG